MYGVSILAGPYTFNAGPHVCVFLLPLAPADMTEDALQSSPIFISLRTYLRWTPHLVIVTIMMMVSALGSSFLLYSYYQYYRVEGSSQDIPFFLQPHLFDGKCDRFMRPARRRTPPMSSEGSEDVPPDTTQALPQFVSV